MLYSRLAFSRLPPLPRSAFSAEGKRQSAGCGSFMIFVEQLARILAAVVLIAAFAMPSLAFAHEGHQPLSAAKVVPALLETQAVKKAAAAVTACQKGT
jgi:hypothetical protein